MTEESEASDGEKVHKHSLPWRSESMFIPWNNLTLNYYRTKQVGLKTGQSLKGGPREKYFPQEGANT